MPAKRSGVAGDLRESFQREADSVLRCLFFARRADVEGRADIAAALRAIADGEVSQAFGHLELLEEVSGAATGGGDAAGDLAAVIATEEGAVERYRELALTARSGGHAEAAEWFESLVAAETVHLGVLRRAAAVMD